MSQIGESLARESGYRAEPEHGEYAHEQRSEAPESCPLRTPPHAGDEAEPEALPSEERQEARERILLKVLHSEWNNVLWVDLLAARRADVLKREVLQRSPVDPAVPFRQRELAVWWCRW